jgi:hypothetical protein
MGTIDHTARARPTVRNEPSSPPDPFIDLRPTLGLGLERFDNCTAKLAGVALAINVVQGVLARSESSKQPDTPRSTRLIMPLNPVQTTGLHAAVYLLQQYADTLNPEPGG